MKYGEKVAALKELLVRVNRTEDRWKGPAEFESYIVSCGGKLRSDKKRKKGFVVCFIQWHQGKKIIVELPKDFVERALVLGGLP